MMIEEHDFPEAQWDVEIQIDPTGEVYIVVGLLSSL